VDTSALPIVTVVMGSLIVLVLVPVVGGLLHCRRERLLTHQERMRALELGHELPEVAACRSKLNLASSWVGAQRAGRSLAPKCFSTTLWVAFWGFVFASQVGWERAGVAVAIASSAGAIGVTAMICGTILALRMPVIPISTGADKPVVESDAFDVVSSRG
jgi:hypothetical protein